MRCTRPSRRTRSSRRRSCSSRSPSTSSSASLPQSAPFGSRGLFRLNRRESLLLELLLACKGDAEGRMDRGGGSSRGRFSSGDQVCWLLRDSTGHGAGGRNWRLVGGPASWWSRDIAPWCMGEQAGRGQARAGQPSVVTAMGSGCEGVCVWRAGRVAGRPRDDALELKLMARRFAASRPFSSPLERPSRLLEALSVPCVLGKWCSYSPCGFGGALDGCLAPSTRDFAAACSLFSQQR